MVPESMNAVFTALASPTRRKILDVVKDQPGCTVKQVAKFFIMSRIGVIKHLRVLAAAGLLISEKVGRTRKLYFNCVPIQMIYDRWTTEYSALWASRLTEIKHRVEEGAMADG
jgi:predicted transcriptional regulator